MRLTTVLQRQHIGFMFKRHWEVSKNRKIRDTGVVSYLTEKGIKVTNPEEYLQKFNVKPTVKIDMGGFVDPKPIPRDENHPEYKIQPQLLYDDVNVLLEGVPQAQVLLKTIVFDEFPDKIADAFENVKLPSDIERSMQQSVLVSHLLDAEQQKLAKLKDPLRPMWNYPRVYGISDSRKNLLLSTRFLNHCERFQGHTRSRDMKRTSRAVFIAPFQREGEKIQFEVTAETFISSRKPIAPINIKVNEEKDVLPDIFPLKSTVSIPKIHFYTEKSDSSYKTRSPTAIKSDHPFSHPHTILLNYSNLLVENQYGKPVTESQFESRAMLKAFAVAASRAHSLYGTNVKEIEKSIPVQVVQFDGKKVQFGIFQLNTLDLDAANGVKNYWFRMPAASLYTECHYDKGRPALTNYNFDIFRMMNVFYCS